SADTKTRILRGFSTRTLAPVYRLLGTLEGSLTEATAALDAMLPLLAAPPPPWLDADSLQAASLSIWAGRLDRAVAHREALPDLVDYLRVEAQVRALGLDQLLDVHRGTGRPVSELPVAYELALYQDLSRFALSGHPELKDFDGLAHQQVRERYQRLDRDSLT